MCTWKGVIKGVFSLQDFQISNSSLCWQAQLILKLQLFVRCLESESCQLSTFPRRKHFTLNFSLSLALLVFVFTGENPFQILNQLNVDQTLVFVSGLIEKKTQLFLLSTCVIEHEHVRTVHQTNVLPKGQNNSFANTWVRRWADVHRVTCEVKTLLWAWSWKDGTYCLCLVTWAAVTLSACLSFLLSITLAGVQNEQFTGAAVLATQELSRNSRWHLKLMWLGLVKCWISHGKQEPIVKAGISFPFW